MSIQHIRARGLFSRLVDGAIQHRNQSTSQERGQPGRTNSSIRNSSAAQRLGVLLMMWLLGAAVTDPGNHTSFVRLPQVQVIEWPPESRLPMLVSAVLLACVSFLGFGAGRVLPCMRGMLSRWTDQITRSLQAHAVMCIAESVFYYYAYSLDTNLLLEMPDGSPHLVMRNLCWAASTPVQWYVFGVTFATTQNKDMCFIYISSVITQIFGILMLISQWKVLICMCGLGACTSYVVMFKLVLGMPLHPITARAARISQCVMLCVWTAYPTAALLRSQEWVSPWSEQVLIYTFLDCISKGITCGAAVISFFLLSLNSLEGTMQLVTASNDFCVVVDSKFKVLDFVLEPHQLSQYFDHTDRSLLRRCLNKEHADRLRLAAEAADSQPFTAPSPKCLVAFQLIDSKHGDEYMLTECLVARCVSGRRVIGVSVTSETGHGIPSTAEPSQNGSGGRLRDEVLSMMSSTSMSRNVKTDTADSRQLLWMLALHNLTCAMEIAPELSLTLMLNCAFLEPHSDSALALYMVDRNSEPEGRLVVVAASAELYQQLPMLSTPMAVSDLVDSSTSCCIANSSKFGHLCLYKRAGTTLCNDTVGTIYAMPFSRIAATSNPDVQFGMLFFDFEGLDTEPDKCAAPHHSFWYYVAGKLLCTSCSMDAVITPPVTVRMPPDVAEGVPIWDLLFSIPLNAPTPDESTVPRVLLAVPRTDVPKEDVESFTSVLTFSAQEATRALASTSRPSAKHDQAPPAVLAPFVMMPSIACTNTSDWLNEEADSASVQTHSEDEGALSP